MPRMENKFAKNWTLNGGMTYGSGTPLTARVLGNQADTAGTGSVGSGRADATGLPITGRQRFLQSGGFHDPAVRHVRQCRAQHHPGSVTVVVESGLSRNFSLGERRRLEFRLDATNLTNHVNFTNLTRS